MKINIFVVAIMAVVCSCSTDFKPKPKGFNHIDLPVHKYQVFKEDSKPYSFEMSVNAFADDDTAHYKEQKRLYKIIKYPDLGSNIHITYKSI